MEYRGFLREDFDVKVLGGKEKNLRGGGATHGSKKESCHPSKVKMFLQGRGQEKEH